MKKLIAATFLAFAALNAEDTPKPAIVETQKPDNNTLGELAQIMMHGDGVDLQDFLRKHKGAQNWTFDKGVTPLMIAAARGDDQMAAVLIEYKADVNARNKNGATALMVAAMTTRNYNYNIAVLLLDNKADVNAALPNGNPSVLHIAIANHDFALADILLQAGANPNVTCKNGADGYTPLMLAADMGDNAAPLANLLLKRGADPELKNSLGETALDRAKDNKGKSKKIEALLQGVPLYLTPKTSKAIDFSK